MIEKATVVFYFNDANKDGQLNLQEFQGFVHKMTNLQVEKVFSEQEQQEMFADLDTDSNGALTLDGNLNLMTNSEGDPSIVAYVTSHSNNTCLSKRKCWNIAGVKEKPNLKNMNFYYVMRRIVVRQTLDTP